MKKLFQINITANWGSHGKIAEEIGKKAISSGWQSFIAYGRYSNPSESHLIKIGNIWDERLHAVESRILDNHGLASKKATRKLVEQIDIIAPDIIHLHNIHGYYLNYPILFEYLRRQNIPVVWTLHDCWSFTGHCTHFEYDNCFKWRTGCVNCKFKKVYPESLLLDNSERNYYYKQRYFTSLNNLTLVPVSNWLAAYIKESFLRDQRLRVIHNGIDINTFRPLNVCKNSEIIEILGVASNWKMRKGLPDFIKLRELLPREYHITLIGLSKDEISLLPEGITGLNRTNSISELVGLYNKSDVLVNPTYEDNYPTINLEAIACGTPVITYKTGGSPESINDMTGAIVEQGDYMGLVRAIQTIAEKGKNNYSLACRKSAEEMFDKDKCYDKYIRLYNELISK